MQANAGDFTYIMYGSLDKPEELPPKGEFFCKVRASWMPEIPGEQASSMDRDNLRLRTRRHLSQTRDQRVGMDDRAQGRVRA